MINYYSFHSFLLLLAYFLYVPKKKVIINFNSRISDLQSKISILEKQDLATEQYNDSLRQEANTVHLYASLSLEEARKTSIKDKQSQIVRSSEHILELLNNEKFSAAAMSHYLCDIITELLFRLDIL
mgnify:CR=1 FL=1